MMAEIAVAVRRSREVAILAPGRESVFSLAREAYSREYICAELDIPGDIETEQDVVRLVAIALSGDPERVALAEAWLQKKLNKDFPKGYPPLPLPLEEIEEKRGIPVTSVLVEENPREELESAVEEIVPNSDLAPDQTPNRSEKIIGYTLQKVIGYTPQKITYQLCTMGLGGGGGERGVERPPQEAGTG